MRLSVCVDKTARLQWGQWLPRQQGRQRRLWFWLDRMTMLTLMLKPHNDQLLMHDRSKTLQLNSFTLDKILQRNFSLSTLSDLKYKLQQFTQHLDRHWFRCKLVSWEFVSLGVRDATQLLKIYIRWMRFCKFKSMLMQFERIHQSFLSDALSAHWHPSRVSDKCIPTLWFRLLSPGSVALVFVKLVMKVNDARCNIFLSKQLLPAICHTAGDFSTFRLDIMCMRPFGYCDTRLWTSSHQTCSLPTPVAFQYYE